MTANGSAVVNLGANDKLPTAQKEIVDAYRSKFRVALCARRDALLHGDVRWN